MDSIKALIFDYGGTLDSGGEHWSHVIYRAYARAGVPMPTQADFRQAYVAAERAIEARNPYRPTDSFRTVMLRKVTLELEHLGIDTSYAPAIADCCNDTAVSFTSHAIPVLRTLASHFTLALVSNFYGNLRAGVLPAMRMQHIFTHVTDSTVEGVRKPSPEIFRRAIARLGIPPQQTAVIGDSVKNDILPAHSLGCTTVLIDGPGWDHTAGSAHTSLPSDTIVIQSMDELPGIFNAY